MNEVTEEVREKILSDYKRIWMEGVDDLARMFKERCDAVGQSRELSLAKTKMEEAVMWAIKHMAQQ